MTQRSGEPRQRADALHNRDLILAVADEVFSEEGAGIPLERIVRALPIGKSTFYRHFPDRESLLVALLDRAIDEFASQVAALSDDPRGLFQLLDLMAGAIRHRAGLVDYRMSIEPNHAGLLQAGRRFIVLLEGPVRQAVAAGLCRADLVAEDIMLWADMVGGAIRGYDPTERNRRANRAAVLFRTGIAVRDLHR